MPRISTVATPTARASVACGLIENEPLEMAFCVQYTKVAGMQFFSGNCVSTAGVALTEDPLVPTPAGAAVPGLYELKTANDFFDPMFRYLALDGVELQIKFCPMSRNVTNTEETDEVAPANIVNDLGTVRVYPWYGQPGMFALPNGEIVPQYLDENYINSIEPAIVKRFPTHIDADEKNPEQGWHTYGFLPIVPQVVEAEGLADALPIQYQRLSPVNTIDWVAGNTALLANLGAVMWYYPHATLARSVNSAVLATRYPCALLYRFKVRVTWFDLLPLQMFEYPTPAVDPVKFKEWALKVLAANEAAAAQELADIALYKEQNGVPPPPPSPVDELTTNMEDAELVDPDDMEDAPPAPPPLKRQK